MTNDTSQSGEKSADEIPNAKITPERSRFSVESLSTRMWGVTAAALVVAIALTLWLSSQNVAFFFWCPVAGLAMILTVLLLERKSPEGRGVVNV